MKYLKTKCQKALNLLKIVSHMDWGADRKTLLRLYRALIRSKLDYGCIVYGSARPSYVKILDTIHNQGLRLCLGAFRTSPMESLYVEANEPSLYNRREQLSLQYAIKLKSNPQNPTYQDTFHPKFTTSFENKPNAIPTFGIRIQQLLNNMNLNINHIVTNSIPARPKWDMKIPIIRYDLHSSKKTDTNPNIFIAKFAEIKQEYHTFKFIYTDGSKKDNRVGSAAVMGRGSWTERLPDEASIFTAELRAILLAFQYIKRSIHNRFIICTDSLSSLQAIGGLLLDNSIILDIINSYTNIVNGGKTVIFCWLPSHIGIEGNEKADAAANLALQLNISRIKIPHSDFKHTIKAHYIQKWQQHWDDQNLNKLHSVKPVLGEWLTGPLKRREELVLSRAHIGHTYLTHKYLLAGEDPPFCVSCHQILTVEHIFLHCVEFDDIRDGLFNVATLDELFRDINPKVIFQFLREAGLYHLF